MNILVSSCLLGERCKYDGGDNRDESLMELLNEHTLFPVCPESAGGLPTPRFPAERKGEKVINSKGKDLTNEYIRGAETALDIALSNNCRIAVLKARSPSCGKGKIYDGNFQGRLISGDGVAAEMLFKNGIEVYTEEEIADRLKMKETTLCHIEKDGKVLMLYRNKKKDDYNAGKWIGVGGKLEKGESPEECLIREVNEETGLTLRGFKKCGVVIFRQNDYSEIMHVYKSDKFTGAVADDSKEGELRWIDKEDLPKLPMWEGDKIFIDLMESTDKFFKVELIYDGDKLIDHRTEF